MKGYIKGQYRKSIFTTDNGYIIGIFKVIETDIEDIYTLCGVDENGKVVKEGEQVVLGANDKYIALCRRHWMSGDLGPDFDRLRK